MKLVSAFLAGLGLALVVHPFSVQWWGCVLLYLAFLSALDGIRGSSPR